jgi:hypothetical protein
VLWHLGSNLIVTTNFDNILEWASPEWPTVWKIESHHGLAQFMKGRHNTQTVWHLHGHIDEPDRLILTPDGYTRLYGTKSEERQYEAALTAFRQILSSHVLLFVGFSFSDDSVNSHLNWLEQTFNGQAGSHFALLRRSDIPMFAARGALKNIQPISYEDHGEPLLARLSEMAKFVEPSFTIEPERDSRPQQAVAPIVSGPSVEWPADLGLEPPESFLLRPEACIVPFHGFRRPLLVHRRVQKIQPWLLQPDAVTRKGLLSPAWVPAMR